MKWLIAIAIVATAACGDNGNNGKKDGGGGSGSDGGMTQQDGGTDGGSGSPFAYCIDKPSGDTLVQRPPTAGLPCDMFPPAALH